jgi:hypothetical protein
MSRRVIRQYLMESPGIRTLFSAVFPIVAGVLSGTFIFEITTSTGLAWKLFYGTSSFYALCVLSLVIYLYNRELYLYEQEISRFRDVDYCVAYVRSKCLPEAAERYKELIRNGSGGELKQAMDELRRALR